MRTKGEWELESTRQGQPGEAVLGSASGSASGSGRAPQGWAGLPAVASWFLLVMCGRPLYTVVHRTRTLDNITLWHREVGRSGAGASVDPSFSGPPPERKTRATKRVGKGRGGRRERGVKVEG